MDGGHVARGSPQARLGGGTLALERAAGQIRSRTAALPGQGA